MVLKEKQQNCFQDSLKLSLRFCLWDFHLNFSSTSKHWQWITISFFLSFIITYNTHSNKHSEDVRVTERKNKFSEEDRSRVLIMVSWQRKRKLLELCCSEKRNNHVHIDIESHKLSVRLLTDGEYEINEHRRHRQIRVVGKLFSRLLEWFHHELSFLLKSEALFYPPQTSPLTSPSTPLTMTYLDVGARFAGMCVHKS